MVAAGNSMTSVSGKARAHCSVSTFPRTAKTGARVLSSSRISGISHIARMNNQVRPFQRAQSLRAQQTVRV